MFESITDINDLRKFACPKVANKSEWWNDCVSCKGKCAAGYRAVVLLDEATAPKEKYDPSKNPKIIAINNDRIQKLYDHARQIFSSGKDAIEALMEENGISYKTARNTIYTWAKNHPSLDDELHIKEYLKSHQKPRGGAMRGKAKTSEEISIDEFLKENPVLNVETVEETDDGVKATAASAETLEELEQKVADQLNEHKPLTLEEFRKEIGMPFQPGEDCWFNPEAATAVNLRTTTDGTATNDNVNCPSHYTFGAIEVIDYIRDKMSPEMFQGFCMGNVLKYISRHKHKNGLEDLKKAQVYLGWLIDSEEG